MRPLWWHLTITLGFGLVHAGCEVDAVRFERKNAANHRWYYFKNMRMGEVLLYKHLDLNTALPGRLTFHIAFVDPTARPDAPV